MSGLIVCTKALSKLEKIRNENLRHRQHQECIDNLICPRCGSDLAGIKWFTNFDTAKCSNCDIEYKYTLEGL